MVVVTIPDNYGWVALATSSIFFLGMYQMTNVSMARAKAEIKYPQLYAEKAETEKSPLAFKFNCAQRAHQNTLESLTMIVFGTMLSGLYHPIIAASSCGLWVLGRVLYTIGYSTGDPAKRNKQGGFLSSIAMLGLGLLGVWTSIEMIWSS